MDQVLGSMKELGFTSSEGRAYVALLRESPATGYELSARSKVPRSAIYGVLKQLEGQGLVAKVDESPARYAPVSPGDLLDLLRGRVNRNLDELKRGLSQVPTRGEAATVWRLRGYDRILERAAELVDGAQESIFLSAWSREVQPLARGLRAAQERAVEPILFSFCRLPEGLGRVFSYDLRSEDLEEFWTHKIVLVADRTQVLMGGANQGDDDTSAVLATDPDVVGIATNNIAMDVTLWGLRHETDVSGVMLDMLHEQVGGLDALLEGRKKGR